VIKVNLLACTHNNTISSTIAKEFADNFTTEMFIHRCYIECGKYAHNNPHMFHMDSRLSSFQRRSQESDAIKAVRKIVGVAIRKCLPYSLMLKEYMINLGALDCAVDVRLVSRFEGRASEQISEACRKSDSSTERHSVFDQMLAKDDKDRDRVRDMLVLDEIIESIKVKQDRATESERKRGSLEIRLQGNPSNRPPNKETPRKPRSGPAVKRSIDLEIGMDADRPYHDQATSIRPTRTGVRLIEEYN
jgi:hypothetical protein